MTIKLYKNNGFSILAVILVIVAVIVAIGVWALSGQINTSNNANNSVDIQAASLINDGLALKSIYDRYKIQGVAQSNITYLPGVDNSATKFNMLDSTLGLPVPIPNPQIIKNSPTAREGYWAYINFAQTSLGTTTGSSSYERMMVVGGIKDSVCKRINYMQNGTETILDLGKDSDNLLFGMGITKDAPKTNTVLIFPENLVIGNTGCGGISTVPDSNLYFIVLQVN